MSELLSAEEALRSLEIICGWSCRSQLEIASHRARIEAALTAASTPASEDTLIRRLAQPTRGAYCLPLGGGHPSGCEARPCRSDACFNKHLAWASLSTDTPERPNTLCYSPYLPAPRATR